MVIIIMLHDITFDDQIHLNIPNLVWIGLVLVKFSQFTLFLSCWDLILLGMVEMVLIVFIIPKYGAAGHYLQDVQLRGFQNTKSIWETET